MTNTLHRQGTVEALKGDYVVFAYTAKGINREGSGPKLEEFMKILLKHGPVNAGDSKQGNILQDDILVEQLVTNRKDGGGAAAVYTSLDTVGEVLDDLLEADLGLSVVVTGLLDQVQECCHRKSLERHSAEHSLGFWGATDRLPEREVLEFNTMCGHGMVSFNLIRKMIEQVKLRRLTPRKAARIMGKCCECGVFNADRAEKLLTRYLSPD
jgi:hypothetical protein